MVLDKEIGLACTQSTHLECLDALSLQEVTHFDFLCHTHTHTYPLATFKFFLTHTVSYQVSYQGHTMTELMHCVACFLLISYLYSLQAETMNLAFCTVLYNLRCIKQGSNWWACMPSSRQKIFTTKGCKCYLSAIDVPLTDAAEHALWVCP